VDVNGQWGCGHNTGARWRWYDDMYIHSQTVGVSIIRATTGFFPRFKRKVKTPWRSKSKLYVVGFITRFSGGSQQDCPIDRGGLVRTSKAGSCICAL
jgi:hypothetical protein